MGILFVGGALAVVGALAVIVVMTLRNSKPTSSIAQVLYDTEHPGRREASGSGMGPKR